MKSSSIPCRFFAAIALFLMASPSLRADEAPRVYVGLQIAPPSHETPKTDREDVNLGLVAGAKIDYVMPGGPADKAGIKKGDIVTAVGTDKAPAEPKEFASLIPKHKAGEIVDFTIMRNGKPMVVKVTIAERPTEPADPAVTLHFGDPAPALATGKWIKGEPVEKFEPGKMYIVEFWATWCGPCKESIPHLTELQKKYPDITFIGQDCSEQDQSQVPAFVEKMGEKMEYRVVMDTADNNMNTTWMHAAGQNGIPCAFLIKDSKVIWIGHPMELEPVLKEVAAGTYDMAATAAKVEAEASKQRQFSSIFRKAMKSGDVTELESFVKEHPDMAAMLPGMKYRIFVASKNYTAALALAHEIVDGKTDNVGLLFQIAASITDKRNPMPNADLDLALKAALTANELTKGAEPMILNLLAQVYAAKGDLDKAIQVETDAVDKSKDQMKTMLSKTLAEYKAKQAKSAL